MATARSPQHLAHVPHGDGASPASPPPRATPERRWRLNAFSLIPAVFAVVGMLALSYPTVASWISQYNQSKIVSGYHAQVDGAEPERAVQLQKAREYNDALSAGALLQANTNVPTGSGTSSDDTLDYRAILTANASGLMGRIKIPSIDVDLPIYHGTSEATLLEGIGHLEGTSLPVGGAGTRTVLTGHRGLADATMFTDLDKVEMGDTFTLEVFGEVLTYEVNDKKVVEPEETETLRVEQGRDLATLVTCTPLGINTHRILLTGERITPTPIADVEDAGKAPTIPHFPWWAIWIPAGLVLVGLYIWWAGTPVAPASPRDATARSAAPASTR
ncbi:class C sortase [Actinomyces sp. B33]|uniref:class C sortase n=1 Tax=Actinomyces sp. B33 TaxID=2942131 RepID=UPI00233F8A66|nr:class C sortase [Actinomyces sp. B33]MDC4232156.1 class C sortase [Actinomyces sp. B33]